MNILITGATGFIGKNLLKAMSHKNNVHVVVRPSTICDSLDAQRIFVFNDNIEELKDYLVKNQIEGIIHLASLYITKNQRFDSFKCVLWYFSIGSRQTGSCEVVYQYWIVLAKLHVQQYGI